MSSKDSAYLAALLGAAMRASFPTVPCRLQQRDHSLAIVWRVPFGAWGEMRLFCPLAVVGDALVAPGIQMAALDKAAANRLLSHPALQSIPADRPFRASLPLGADAATPLLSLQAQLPYQQPRCLQGTFSLTSLPVLDVMLQIPFLPHPVDWQQVMPALPQRDGFAWVRVAGTWRQYADGEPPAPGPSLLSVARTVLERIRVQNGQGATASA